MRAAFVSASENWGPDTLVAPALVAAATIAPALLISFVLTSILWYAE